jgi:hypothetical protein
MNTKSITESVFIKIGLLAIMSVLIQSCGGRAPATATLTPEPTFTLLPAKSATPNPTSTSQPTSTPQPTDTVLPTPTPAALGEAVQSGSMGITVLDVIRHDHIIPGGMFYYYANPGYMIIDLEVKVQNLGSSPVSIKWNDLYVVDESGLTRNTQWAGSQKAGKKEKVDPLKIDYHDVTGSEVVTFSDAVYMRAIFVITDKPVQTVLFGIQDSPLIGFKVKK